MSRIIYLILGETWLFGYLILRETCFRRAAVAGGDAGTIGRIEPHIESRTQNNLRVYSVATRTIATEGMT